MKKKPDLTESVNLQAMESVTVPAFTRTQLRVIERLVHGDYDRLACVKSGLPGWHTERYITPEMRAEVARIQAQLTEQAREKCLADAGEIHEFLSDAFRARMSDIRNDDHTFKPRSEWPEIWDRLEEAGEVEVEYESVRSHDGKDTEGRGGWETGGCVRKVKFKFSSKTKLIELLMKHKGVNAIADQTQNLNINITVTAEEQRMMAAAERRRSKVIDVTPES